MVIKMYNYKCLLYAIFPRHLPGGVAAGSPLFCIISPSITASRRLCQFKKPTAASQKDL